MLELTNEQVPTRIDEYERVLSQGGYVVPVGQTLRVQGVLSITRAIGDLPFKDFLISEPEVNSIQICPQDQFLILASDGIFRAYSKQQVADKVLELRRCGYRFGEIAH